MAASTVQASEAPVRKSVVVKTSVERAFEVFTAGIDTWWPRGHHIGSAPLKRVIVEGRVGGRWYSQLTDGTECDWGQILAWEPPNRFVMAWQISPEWKYEPDLGKSSEVEVRFKREADGSTRVELEHRYFERHGAGGATVRTAVGAPEGWAGLLESFAGEAERKS